VGDVGRFGAQLCNPALTTGLVLHGPQLVFALQLADALLALSLVLPLRTRGAEAARHALHAQHLFAERGALQLP
jgi:hypothetical protein